MSSLPSRHVLTTVWQVNPRTTTEAVADELGVTVGHLLRHFSAVGFAPPVLASMGPRKPFQTNKSFAEASSCLARHWNAFNSALRPGSTTGATDQRMGRRTTAVCVTGAMRLFGLSLFNMQWALRSSLAGMRLYIVGPKDASFRYHAAFTRSHAALDVKSHHYNTVAVANLGSDADLWRLVNHSTLLINAAHAPALGFATEEGRVRKRMVNMVVQLYQQHTCAEMIRRDEISWGMNYTRVIKTRTDIYFFNQPPVPREGRVLWPQYHRRQQRTIMHDLFFDAPRAQGLALLTSDETLLKPLRRGDKIGNLVYAWGFIVNQWTERAQLEESRLRRPVLDKRLSFLGILRGLPGCGGWRPSTDGLVLWPRERDGAQADPTISAAIVAASKDRWAVWEAQERRAALAEADELRQELGVAAYEPTWSAYIDEIVSDGCVQARFESPRASHLPHRDHTLLCRIPVVAVHGTAFQAT